eukprot:12907775-Prorocentrum_lima.AAC.1
MYPGAFQYDDYKEACSYDGGHASGFIIDVIKPELSFLNDEDFLSIILTSHVMSADWEKAMHGSVQR